MPWSSLQSNTTAKIMEEVSQKSPPSGQSSSAVARSSFTIDNNSIVQENRSELFEESESMEEVSQESPPSKQSYLEVAKSSGQMPRSD